MIRGLLSLLSLLSRTLAINLTLPAFARRRLKKTSIYLSWKWPPAMASAWSAARAGRSDNSDNSDNRPGEGDIPAAASVAAVTALVMIGEIRRDG